MNPLKYSRLLAALLLLSASAFAASENLGRGLNPLLEEYRLQLQSGKSDSVSFQTAIADAVRAQADVKQRVLVDILLDGKATPASVRSQCETLGGSVTATVGWYRHGLISAWMPLSQVERLAHTAGVSAVHLAPRRRLHIGLVTTQGAIVHKSDLANKSGYLGAGATVGVLSDSFNDDRYDDHDPGWTNEARDISTGDLPGRLADGQNNPDGYNTPVIVLHDGGSPYTDTDEGRAMLQIVHDVAPAADLAFCTTGNTDGEMAQNINSLVGAGCNVICDDVAFDDEPMYSDGVIAQAINTAATSSTVAYFSAIGNDGNSGYQATFNPIANATARKQAAAEGVVLSTIPVRESKVIYQWHGFGTDTKGNPVVVQKITTGSEPTTLIFQWNDPFDAVTNGTNGMTADYDILVFNAAGDFSAKLSGTDNNIATNEPLELPLGNMRPYTTYKIAIVLTTRVNGSQPRLATCFRYLATDGADSIIGDYITLSNVAAYGHSTAAGCTGVAAYVYDIAPDPGNSSHVYDPLPDGYSSNGPIEIYFDSNGNRLGSPTIRDQPAFACTDNVDTTFFPPFPTRPNPYDYDDDGFPNFAGTSAATPHAAGIAALLIGAAAAAHQAAPTPQQIQTTLINTTQGQVDEDPIYSSATAGIVTVSDSGDGISTPNEFQVAFSGTTGQTLTSVAINLLPVAMHFDTGRKNGLPFIIDAFTGKPHPVPGVHKFSGGPTGKSSITIPFKKFEPGDTFQFSIGFDDDDTGLYGYDADEIAGATFTAVVSGTTVSGTFANQLGKTWNYKCGYGLLDAQAAINALLSP